LNAPRQSYTSELVKARRDHPKPLQNIPEIEPPLLDVRQVTAAYGGGVKGLEDINVVVRKGETVAVVGESGSGKSTLARVITGLLPPIAGEIRYNGKTLPPALPQRQRGDLRHLQMIYQMPDVALNPRQTIAEILGRPVTFYLNPTSAER